jgi:crossover junction endodeoxyribonuclease RuvC
VTIIGIDPGLFGGIAFLEEGGTAAAFPLPVDGKDLDVTALFELVKCGQQKKAFVEVPFLPANQSGALTNGTNYGRILAVLTLLKVPTQKVTPVSWSNKMLGKKETRSKGANIALAKQLFPHTELVQPRCKTPHDGVADALLIAEWGRRHG